jgi:hypothetical protein
MPCYSLAGGIDAAYAVEAGATSVTINSKGPLKHRAVYTGTGRMIFHWVQEGKTQAWRCDISMLDPEAVQVAETAGEDGSRRLAVGLKNVYPAGLILQGRMVGTLMAPAIHVDVPWGEDVWVFLIRSPWFPLKLRIDKPALSVAHDAGKASASLSVLGEGNVSAQVALDGTNFKSASLVVRRTLGSFSSNEVVCEVGTGAQTFVWKPIVRVFDLLLVVKGSVTEGHIADVARGLGAQISSGILGGGNVEGDFVLCDGPATSYAWILRGHRGLLENEEDQSDAKFTW